MIPYPFVSLLLFATWLLLVRSLSPGHLALAAALAIAWPLALKRLDFPRARIRRPSAILRLALHVARDIVRSNIAVGRIVLPPMNPRQTAAFMQIPLELKSPHALATLACIVTATPGTLWVDYDADSGMMTLHVLDLVDESAWVRKIKGDYEALLMEIFE